MNNCKYPSLAIQNIEGKKEKKLTKELNRTKSKSKIRLRQTTPLMRGGMTHHSVARSKKNEEKKN